MRHLSCVLTLTKSNHLKAPLANVADEWLSFRFVFRRSRVWISV